MVEIDSELIRYLSERAENIKKYSDKLTDSLHDIDEIFTPIIEKIDIGYVDIEPLYQEKTEYGIITYHLKIKKSVNSTHAGITVRTNTPVYPEYDHNWIHETPRYLQKKIIKRLPVFLKEYSEYVAGIEADYKEVSELAEKMLNAIKKEE